tara:strand:+ start:337 stop:591 length:255 start_codon:yes stop_codon:yes gene_type:complete
MNTEEQLLAIKQITGNLDEDPVEAVRKLRKRYEQEYQRNRDKAMNNGCEVIFTRLEIKKVKEELRGFKNSYLLLKKKLEKLKDL